MDFIIELILELLIEGTFEASQSKSIPKGIRYPLIVLIALIFVAVIGLVVFFGVIILDEMLFGGIFFIGIGVFMAIMAVIKFRKLYLEKKK